MNLLEIYCGKLAAGSISHDPVQEQAVVLLDQAVADFQLLQSSHSVAAPQPSSGLFSFFSRKKADVTPSIPKGVYLWGGVGRGKTWLMDLFYDYVPVEKKRRYHFHHMMELIHKAIKQHPDQEEPLKLIANEWAQDMQVLCLDELHLTEIANARLLLPLLEYLMREGVMLVSTSNRSPDELYQGNLKKELFVPYTQFMEAHMEVFHLDNGQDYRMRGIPLGPNGELPKLAPVSTPELEQQFREMAEGEVVENTEFTINYRQVPIVRAADNVVWLDFAEACEGTRTIGDYIWLCDRYPTIMLSDVFIMTEDHEPVARRFFNMVDEVYDRGVRLVFSSEAPLDELYQGKRLTFAFRRTLSRLTAIHYMNNDGAEEA